MSNDPNILQVIKDWAGVISLGFSIIIGSLNFWYTNRQFRAVYHPNIQMSLKDKDCESGVCPQLHIKNMSKDKSIVQANIRLLIQNPSRPFFLNFPRWAEMVSQTVGEIGPNLEYTLADSTEREFKSMEQFMLHKFSKYIDSEQLGKSQFRYYLAHNRPILLRAVIRYKSSITGSGWLTTKQNFHIQPETSQRTGRGFRLSHWKF